MIFETKNNNLNGIELRIKIWLFQSSMITAFKNEAHPLNSSLAKR